MRQETTPGATRSCRDEPNAARAAWWRWGVRRRVLATLGAAVAIGLVVAPMPGPARALALPAESAAAYVAVQPCRLADTRTGAGSRRVDALTVQVSARDACGVPADATSLALTLTVVGATAAGYLTAWPADQARPTVSNINFAGGQIRANGSITRIDSTGSLRVFTNVPADVVVDVVGAFVPSGAVAAGRFVPQTPSRLLDTRTSAPVAPASKVNIAVPPGVPADVVALALNITVTESSGPGFVTQFPAGRSMPTSSVLNVDRANQTRAAAGIFPVSSAGASLYLSAGGHVVVDLVGYFTGPSAGASTEGLFTAYDPERMLDTRVASTLGVGVPLYPGGGLELSTGRGGGSMAYNLTSVDGDAGYITAYPAGTVRPATSNVNSAGRGDIVANFAITQMSGRGLGLFSQARTHALVDLQGWFSGAPAEATAGVPSNAAPPAVAAPGGQQPEFSDCIREGLTTLNGRRPAVTALAANPRADEWACSWALQMATAGTISHSATAARDAAVGCPTGENVAFSSSTSVPSLYTMWFGSPPHLANILNPAYRSAGIGIVIRTDPSGAKRIFGVNVFSFC